MYKKIIAAVMILLLALTGCGTSSSNDTANGSEGNGAVENEVEEDLNMFEATLEHIDGMNYKLTVTLAKEHEKEETLTFTSSQRFNYVLKDSEGEINYNYAADKMFALMVEEKIIKPGETIEFEIDVTEALAYIEAGTYTLEAWVTATEVEEDKATSPFTFDGNMPKMEATVEYTGQIDTHSIEVTTEDGEIEVYQLAAELQTAFSDVEAGAKLNIQYTVNDVGQKVIESFEVVK